MIPFHKIYWWLFKSFSIGEESKLVERLIEQWYDRMMIVKRSWIFMLYFLWIPVLLIILSGVSIWLALTQLPASVPALKGIIIIGNILMTIILVGSSWVYIRHFRQIYSQTDKIITDIPNFIEKLKLGDKYFITFFNWSITNQWLLVVIMLLEIVFIITNLKHFNEHFLFLTIDFAIIIGEIFWISRYRKRMMDMEMDFNVVVQGKIFFVNQSGLLSDTQTLESDKIKTIKSKFPNKLAGFFNYGDIDILTEGDQWSLGAMAMNFVTSPVAVVNSIQQLLGEIRSIPPKMRDEAPTNNLVKIENSTPIEVTTHENSQELAKLHTIDTRGKIRDILR